jgi:CYTH domain-containing protein
MKEIERKFLVDAARLDCIKEFPSKVIKQAYIQNEAERSVRVRTKGEKAFLTIKSGKTALNRDEFEYEIPVADALEMFERLGLKVLSKMRFLVPFGNHTWEVDVFEGKLKGIVVAEIELSSEDELFEKQDWILKEFTEDSSYLNTNLIKQL